MENQSLTEGQKLGELVRAYFTGEIPFFVLILANKYIDYFRESGVAWKNLKGLLDNNLYQMITQYNALLTKIEQYFYEESKTIPPQVIVYAHNIIVNTQFDAAAAWEDHFLPFLESEGIDGFINNNIENYLEELNKSNGFN